jgi:hypothetical protein
MKFSIYDFLFLGIYRFDRDPSNSFAESPQERPSAQSFRILARTQAIWENHACSHLARTLLGVHAVVVEAKNAAAQGFYRKYG